LKNDTPISGTITRNSSALFTRRNKVVQSKDNEKIAELKSDCSLFSKLYIANQAREGTYFSNMRIPRSLADGVKLRQAKKADLLDYLESYCSTKEAQRHPSAEVRVLDCAAVVHFLPLRNLELLENMPETFSYRTSLWN